MKGKTVKRKDRKAWRRKGMRNSAAATRRSLDLHYEQACVRLCVSKNWTKTHVSPVKGLCSQYYSLYLLLNLFRSNHILIYFTFIFYTWGHLEWIQRMKKNTTRLCTLMTILLCVNINVILFWPQGSKNKRRLIKTQAFWCILILFKRFLLLPNS